MNEQPSYFSIIPACVRYDKRLSANAKLLYAEITSLTHKTGECFATTSYFSELYGMCKSSIQKMLFQLEKCGYISRRVEYKKDSKQIDKRYITILPYPSVKNYTTPSVKNYQDNNTSNNNTSNNNTPKPPKGCLEVDVYIKSIFDYYNQRACGCLTNSDYNKLCRCISRLGIKPKEAFDILKFWAYNHDDDDFAPVVETIGEFILKANRLIRWYETYQ